MKKLKGKRTTMRGLADRQIIGAIINLETRLNELTEKHNALVAGVAEIDQNVGAVRGAVASLGGAMTWCLHKLGHPKFLDPKFGDVGTDAGIMLTDQTGIVTP